MCKIINNYLLIFLSTLMHQSIPAAPSPPRLLRGVCPPCHSQGWGISKFSLPGDQAFANRGAIPPSFWHARGFLCEYNYTEDFTGKTSILSYVKHRKKLKRVVKACSRFYACISSLLIKQEFIPRKPEPVDVNQRFFGYWIKFLLILFEEHPFIFIKLFITYNFTALY